MNQPKKHASSSLAKILVMKITSHKYDRMWQNEIKIQIIIYCQFNSLCCCIFRVSWHVFQLFLYAVTSLAIGHWGICPLKFCGKN